MQHHIYSAFGELVNTLDASGNVISGSEVLAPFFSYTNREYDKESGLYYYRARTYDASIGRFLEVDPYSGVRYNPISVVNKYTYVENKPTRYTDPLGLFSLKISFNFSDLFNPSFLFNLNFLKKDNVKKIIGNILPFLFSSAQEGPVLDEEEEEDGYEPGEKDDIDDLRDRYDYQIDQIDNGYDPMSLSSVTGLGKATPFTSRKQKQRSFDRLDGRFNKELSDIGDKYSPK